MGLHPIHPERERQLRDLHADLGRRLRAGEACRVEAYLEQCPHLVDDEEAVLELLYLEYVVREEMGERPAPEEWYARFPGWHHRLRRLLELHRVFEDPREPTPASIWTAGPSGPTKGGDRAGTEARGRLRLGPFELIEEIGRGGMGVVYKARQTALNRVVAVKVILAGGLAGPRERARLRFEAEAVARLHHPNIVQIHEFIDQEDLPYLVLEYVEGCSLAELQRRSERRIDWSARLIETLARAIHHAHQRGIVHRDLTPVNVLIALDGTPKISDFGLAKSLANDVSNSSSGSLVGTPRYMAPEQVLGRSSGVGPPADIYSLGAILYELLTGTVPFRGKSPLETLQLVVEDVPETPSRVRADVPLDLATICLKCLERNPERRYLSAAELADDLRRFLAGEPIRARPISKGRRLLKWARRRPAEAALAAAAALFVVGITVPGRWSNATLSRHKDRLTAALAEARGHAVVARQERARAEQGERLARRRWYASRLKLAQQAWEARHVELAQELLENEHPGTAEADLRGFEWAYLHRLCHREFSLLWGHAAAVCGLAVAPDGRSLASVDRVGNLQIRDLASGATMAPRPGPQGDLAGYLVLDAATGRPWSSSQGNGGPIRLLGFPGEGKTLLVSDRSRAVDLDRRRSPAEPSPMAPVVALSPDGRLLAVAEPGVGPTLREVATGRERMALETIDSGVMHLSFSGEGERLAAALGDGGVAVWRTGDGRLLEVFPDHEAPVTLVALSPDQAVLAAREGGGRVVLRDLVGSRTWSVRLDPAAEVHAMAFSSDGRTLALGGDRFRPFLCDVATGEPRSVFSREVEVVRSLAFTPDGRTLILGGDDPRIRLWHLAPVPDGSLLAGHPAETRTLAFSPDGRTLASGSDDMTIALWDIDGLRKRATLIGQQAAVSALAFSPDGRTLAAADLGRQVKLWDVDRTQVVGSLSGHLDRVRAVAFSPDGATLVSAGTDRTIRLWDVSSRTCRAILEGHDDAVRAVAFSPDGRTLASAGDDGRVILHDPIGGRPRRSWKGPSKVTSLAFSPDGTRLALGGEDRGLTVWDPADGRLITTNRGNGRRVLSVAFSPDGATLASAGEDRLVRLWDPVTGLERLTLRGHDAEINAVVFSPDGGILASAGRDGAVKVWRATR